MIDWKKKLTSRKMWAAIAVFVTMIIVYITGDEENGSQVSALIMAGGAMIAYIVGEGFADGKGASKPDAINIDDLIYDPSDPSGVCSSEDGVADKSEEV